MKTVYFTLLLCLPLLLSSQNIDTSKALAQADSLLQLARSLVDQQNPIEAFETNERAGTLIAEKIGAESGTFVSYLIQKGFLLLRSSKYADAEPVLLSALSLEEKRSGKKSLDYVRALDYLGYGYWRLGRYEASEKAYLEGLEIGEEVIGKEHDRYLSTLNHLATLYRQIGRYDVAKERCLEALDIQEKVFGKESKEYASTLTILAAIYQNLGNLERFEQLNLEALAIKEKVLGKEHPGYALVLNNLSIAYSNLGNYKVAEDLLLEAKTIRKKTLGVEHVDYAETLGYLANLYSDLEQFEQSEPYYLEARGILEKTQGKMNSDYALVTNNMANLYVKMGKLIEAEALYLEAKVIRAEILGKEHRFYASTINNLANLYLELNEIEKAEPLVLEAKSIYQKILGADHYLYVYILNNLTNLYWKKNHYQEASLHLQEACAIQKSQLLKGTRHLSEQELGDYKQEFLGNIYKSFSLASLNTGPKGASDSYNLALFYKGFLLTESRKIRRLVEKDEATIEKFDTLKSYHSRLANEYAKRLPSRNVESVAALEMQAKNLEKDLAQTVAGFDEAMRQVNWQEVRAKLNSGETAMEFVRYELLNPKPTDTVLYAAIVLRPENPKPLFVPLTSEKQLDLALKKSVEKPTDYINQLYTFPSSPDQQSLYQVLWQPLEKALEGTHTIYFSPTGLLYRLNLSAIPAEDHKTLGGRYQLIRLGSTRQLTEIREKNDQNKNAMLFGGIQYEVDSVALNTTAIASRGSNKREEPIPFIAVDATLRGGDWDYLQWTEVEIDAIDIILQDAGIKPTVKQGYAATEEAFKSISINGPSPHILHLATHGFFFPDPGEKIGEEAHQEDSSFEVSEHPMIRSGLILAGANHAWKTGKTIRPNLEDGVLTAYEISQMDLSNTDLVVLSACETGLGDIQGNEGVYGLQRAFKIAGAKYLIMSLWQIPDFQTQELMTTFYLNWLDAKMSIPAAFYAAQTSIREKYPEPFSWAGFVLVE